MANYQGTIDGGYDLIDRLKPLVEEVLRESIEAQNDYKVLLAEYFLKANPEFERFGKELKPIMIRAFKKCPSFEDVTRACREIQNTEKRYQARPEVQEGRRKKEEMMRSRYGG